MLRRAAHAGHAWFTVEVDPAGLRALGTQPARDGLDVPADADWRDALLTAAGLGTYEGQTCPGYHHHGSPVGRDGPGAVWLVPRLTRLTDAITDTVLHLHDRTCQQGGTQPHRRGR